ncbi:ATP-binding cassette domain-containing protein [Rubellimicrobium sp. CFH 75288]|uniref:ATP-binding cassette domain-containing protein n=1 Tax=Rubellimicrobium sp. CFH 75288 TaxID=2697034 RepID=UPI00352BBC87
MSAPPLVVEGLEVRAGRAGPAVVRGVSLTVPAGGCLALVGESGSGKSVTALAALGRLPPGLVRTGGRVALLGRNPAALPERALRALLAEGTGFVPQDPLAALDPLHPVADQIVAPRCPDGWGRLNEALSAVLGSRRPGRAERRRVAAALLERMGLRDAEARAGAFPHAFSGGMRQRALIAAATRHAPALVVADEPTTALDAAVERQVLTLLREAAAEAGAGLLLVSHDLGLVAWFADRVAVMREGRIVEEGETEAVFRAPREAYTRALLGASPALRVRRVAPRPPPGGRVLLSVEGVSRRYGGVAALTGATLSVQEGEFLAVVGESGSGKSTLGRLMLGLEAPDEGRVLFAGEDLARLRPAALRRLRAEMQPVFQDPLSSLDPRWSVGRSVAEPLRVAGLRGWPSEREAVAALLERVGLGGMERRRPSELSGGQRQRVAIARALAPRPRLIVADEAVSALDVTTQGRVMALLAAFRREGGAVVFVTHDLRLAAEEADRVAVVEAGRIVELGPPDAVLGAPSHPYTQRLVGALLPPRFPLPATLSEEVPS